MVFVHYMVKIKLVEKNSSETVLVETSVIVVLILTDSIN